MIINCICIYMRRIPLVVLFPHVQGPFPTSLVCLSLFRTVTLAAWFAWSAGLDGLAFFNWYLSNCNWSKMNLKQKIYNCGVSKSQMQHNRKKEMGIKWVRSRAGFGGETGWKYRLQRCFGSCKNVAERYFAHIDWRGLHCDFIVDLNTPKTLANWLWCTFQKKYSLL